MKIRTLRLALPLLLCVQALTAGCVSSGSSQISDGEQADFVPCEDPRPELCTQHYDPVCASRDTGIRCVTTPCDSSEWRRYPNACVACSDKDVYGYRAGDCNAEDTES